MRRLLAALAAANWRCWACDTFNGPQDQTCISCSIPR